MKRPGLRPASTGLVLTTGTSELRKTPLFISDDGEVGQPHSLPHPITPSPNSAGYDGATSSR